MIGKLAKIAVAAATYWIDKPYDYIIPESMENFIQVGMRVTVPFSRGNRQSEGFVLAITKGEVNGRLKVITSILDEKPILSFEQIKLAVFMRERFFCTVFDAAKAMLPAGLFFNLSQQICLTKKFSKEKSYELLKGDRGETQIFDYLFENDGFCELKDLELNFKGSSLNNDLLSMQDKKILEISYLKDQKVNDKTLSYLSLNISVEEAEIFINTKKRSAPIQASIIKLLSDFGVASTNDIRYMTGAKSSNIKKLIDQGLIISEQRETFQRPKYRENDAKALPILNQEQAFAYNGILSLMDKEKASVSLLHGVTGSGKTAVYVNLIEKVLKQGKSSIFMVPEIALTPQMLAEFSSYFGDEIAVIHSSLTARERYDEWKRIKQNKARVIIGTRSAIFAPCENLGLIIIDEEQEDTYKSENSPRYHARDVAKYRCFNSNAVLLLGSATPSIESFYKAKIGVYSYFQLKNRFNQKNLPSVQIVDMKKELRNGNGGDLSMALIDELSLNLAKGEQSILFINRRGMNKLITCSQCGYTYTCPRCSVSLTYHSANKRLMCHHCGYSMNVHDSCPECGGELKYTGSGTQKIVEEIFEHFPETEVLRMDTDTVSGAGSHDIILNKFREENVPILVGTQMVTKGLDFENVTLVGVVSADQALYCGDYRAQERAFSLITQVVGRSGRGEKAGRAIIQTFTPNNETVLQASKQDYISFYNSEIELRRLQWCPPFSQILSLTAIGQNESLVLKALHKAKNILVDQLKNEAGVRILGPAPLAVAKVNFNYRYRLSIASSDDKFYRHLIEQVIGHLRTSREFVGVTVFGDINPN